MGHKTNAIGFRLGLGIYWNIIAVTLTSTYSRMLQKLFHIKQICNNLLANYTTPPDKRRNDKTMEQKDRGLQAKIIQNAFVSANMIFSHTVIRQAKKLEVNNNFLDGGLLEKKMQQHKDPSKKDSSYLKPKSWKRFLPDSLFAYVNAAKAKKKTLTKPYKSSKNKKIRFVWRSFKKAFGLINPVKHLGKPISVRLTTEKAKEYLRPRRYRLISRKSQEYYAVLVSQEKPETNTAEITNNGAPLGKLLPKREEEKIAIANSYLFFSRSPSLVIFFKRQRKILALLLALFAEITRNLREDNAQKGGRKHKKLMLRKRCNKLRRFPLMQHKFFMRQTKNVSIPSGIGDSFFVLLKSIILTFNYLINIYIIKFVLKLFKTLLLSLIKFNYGAIVLVHILSTLVILDFGEKDVEIKERNLFLNARYWLYHATNFTLLSAITPLMKNGFFRFAFFGKHTRNVSAQILLKYILQKLGQYFTIQEILKPIIFDLRSSPLLNGFKIIIAGRVTRKERAAFLIKKAGNLPLNKKVAKVDYAANAKIQKFGMVGIKVLLYEKRVRTSYYKFSFDNNYEELYQLFCLWFFIAIMCMRLFGRVTPKQMPIPAPAKPNKQFTRAICDKNNDNSKFTINKATGPSGNQEKKDGTYEKNCDKLDEKGRILGYKNTEFLGVVGKTLERAMFRGGNNFLPKELSNFNHMNGAVPYGEDDEHFFVFCRFTSSKKIYGEHVENPISTTFVSDTNIMGKNKKQFAHSITGLVSKEQMARITGKSVDEFRENYVVLENLQQMMNKGQHDIDVNNAIILISQFNSKDFTKAPNLTLCRNTTVVEGESYTSYFEFKFKRGKGQSNPFEIIFNDEQGVQDMKKAFIEWKRRIHQLTLPLDREYAGKFPPIETKTSLFDRITETTVYIDQYRKVKKTIYTMATSILQDHSSKMMYTVIRETSNETQIEAPYLDVEGKEIEIKHVDTPQDDGF